LNPELSNVLPRQSAAINAWYSTAPGSRRLEYTSGELAAFDPCAVKISRYANYNRRYSINQLPSLQPIIEHIAFIIQREGYIPLSDLHPTWQIQFCLLVVFLQIAE